MSGETLVGRNFRKHYKSYDHKYYTYVSGDPGLHANIFKFIKVAFIIKWKTSKTDVQGLFRPTVECLAIYTSTRSVFLTRKQ